MLEVRTEEVQSRCDYIHKKDRFYKLNTHEVDGMCQNITRLLYVTCSRITM